MQFKALRNDTESEYLQILMNQRQFTGQKFSCIGHGIAVR